ncbi:MAG: hypothetical protein GY909_12855 [Oligoflexia bacterium]|nr:hypothetical protein [Oligoflexia bacterium]
MEKVNFQVNGIYDQRTIKALKELGVCRFGFDFRPRNLNFIQQHNLMNIAKEFLGDETVIFTFENEKDFIIEKIVGDFKNEYSNDFFLSFSCDQEVEFYQNLKHPFYILYRPWFKVNDFYQIENFKGFIFDEVFLEELSLSNKLDSFASNFLGHWHPFETKKEGELLLDMKWNSELSASIDFYFDFHFKQLNISNEVETCFRNVNLNLVKDWFQLTNSPLKV